MARWRQRDKPQPHVPDWIRFEYDGGFVQADWAWPEDAGLPAWLAEHRARGRWTAARHRWLQEHDDAAELLFRQLKERAGRKRRTAYGSGDLPAGPTAEDA